jgi:hypothetical protein
MKHLVFGFTSLLPEVHLRPGLRTSVWADDAPEYCMPCEFQHVDEVSAHITVLALDPTDRVSERHVLAPFSFGHPGRVVGRGQLLACQREGE